MNEAVEPSFRTIAELFQVPIFEDEEGEEEVSRPKRGETADESEELGRMSLTDGDYENAIRHFRDAVAQREPGDIRSQMELAGALAYGDQSPQALRQYERALQMKGDAVEPHIGISEVYRRYGRFREAVEELQRAVALEPANPYHHFKLAETYREMGQRRLALAAAQGAILCKPDDAFYHFWIGDLLIQMKRYPEALDSFRAAIELSPGDDHLYLRASVAFWLADRKSEAMKSVRLASDLNPEKHVYHGLLGILLEESGQLEEAALESNRAEKMDRYDQEILSRLLDELGIEP